MNVGGGDIETKDSKESRKAIVEEVIEKSKAYKLMQSEIKMAGEQLINKLDDEFHDILPLLDMRRDKRAIKERE